MRPTASEYGLLTSLALILLERLQEHTCNELLFFSPYLIQRDPGRPHAPVSKIFMPPLEGRFQAIIEKAGGDIKVANKRVWAEYHENGRDYDEGRTAFRLINKFDRPAECRSEPVLMDVTEIPREIAEREASGGFRVIAEGSLHILTVGVRQSCDTLIAIFGFVFSSGAAAMDARAVLEPTLEGLRQHSFRQVAKTFHIPNLSVCEWRNIRLIDDGQNHWGESDRFSRFVGAGNAPPWSLLMSDFGQDFEAASKPTDWGRPSLNDVLSIDAERDGSRLQRVIGNRVKAILGKSSSREFLGDAVVVGFGRYDVLWFNAMALAEAIAAAVQGYGKLPNENTGDARIWVPETWRHSKAKCVPVLTLNETDKVAVFRLFEPGLVGEYKVKNGGTDFSRVLDWLALVGAEGVRLVSTNYRTEWQLNASNVLDVSDGRLNQPTLVGEKEGFTGVEAWWRMDDTKRIACHSGRDCSCQLGLQGGLQR